MKRFTPHLEKALFALFLLLALGDLKNLWWQHLKLNWSLVWGPALGIMLVYLLAVLWRDPRRRSDFSRAARANLPLWLVVLFALLSLLWSVLPSQTLVAAIGLLALTLLGFYSGVRFSIDELLTLLAWAAAAAVLASLFLVWRAPDVAILQEGPFEGIWRGVYQFKNNLGRVMALGNLVFMLRLFFQKTSLPVRLVNLFFYAATIFMVFQADAGTMIATIALVNLTALGLWIYFKWAYRIHWGFIAALLAAGVVLVVLNFERLTRMLGRPPTLSGRTDKIWPAIWSFVPERWLAGYGYKTFWSARGDDVSAILRGGYSHAHSGYLEVILGLGFIGLALVLLALGFALFRAVRHTWRTRTVLAAFPLLLLLAIAFISITLSDLLEYSDSLWVFVAMASALVSPSVLGAPGAQSRE